MKLFDLTGWNAKVYGELKITEDIEDGDFPLNIGSVTITSKDGKRNFVLDSTSTDFDNPETAGETFEFTTEFGIDEETFPSDEDNNYELTKEDLADSTAVLYLSRCDMEEGDFDFENPDVKLVFDFGGEEISLKVSIEE